jgi:hypothetical protein
MDDETIGRFEALSQFVLQLTAALEMQGLLDGPTFCQRLRGSERMQDQLEYMRIARLRVGQLADALDRMREVRSLRHPRPAS